MFDLRVWLIISAGWVIGLLITTLAILFGLDSYIAQITIFLTVLGLLIAGTVGFLGLIKANPEDKQLGQQHESDRKLERQQLYATYIQHLGHSDENVRRGGIYGLGELAKESEILAPKIATMFCKHICSTTSEADYQTKYRDEPSFEISAIMEVLTELGNPFDSTQFDLRYAYLVGANLRRAKLKGANMFGINLAGATLEGAELRGVELTCADLNLANLKNSNLECAFLGGTRMIKTNLEGANLSFSEITGGRSGLDLRSMVDLRGASLKNANLVGVYLDANLTGAELEGASLIGASLGGVIFSGTNLKNAKIEGCGDGWSNKIQPQEAFKQRIGQNSKFGIGVIVGPAPTLNLGVPENTDRGYPKRGKLKHQTPGSLEERWVDITLMSIDGRLTDLRNISYGVLTQGLCDAIMMDRDTGKTENADQYRAEHSIRRKLTQEEKEDLFRSDNITTNVDTEKDDVSKCRWGDVLVLEEKGTQGNSKAK